MTRTRSDNWVPKPGTILGGHYRLGEVFDQGGMGVIMRAEHVGLGHEVAVKLLKPDVADLPGYLARFRREVDVAAGLDHPNIVKCHASGETPDGSLFMVMELLKGRSLKEAIASAVRFDLQRAIDVAVELADGLAAAHRKGIVHRDLKPGNIYLVPGPGTETVKILDFGLAKSLLDDDIKITKTGAICGTAAYLAPETLVTQGNTMAGDVYACGLLFQEMVTGEQLFGSPSLAQALLQHLTVPARVPVRLWETPYGQLVARCLQKHPDDRPRDASELHRALVAMRPALPKLWLEDEEVPPRAGPGDLTNSFVQHIMAGKKGFELLRKLPQPQPFLPRGDVPKTTENPTVESPHRQIVPRPAPPERSTEVEALERLSEFERDLMRPHIELARIPRAPAASSDAVAPADGSDEASPGRSPARDILLGLVIGAVVCGGVWYLLESRRPTQLPPVEKKVEIPATLLKVADPPPPPAGGADAGTPDAGARPAGTPKNKRQDKKRKGLSNRDIDSIAGGDFLDSIWLQVARP